MAAAVRGVNVEVAAIDPIAIFRTNNPATFRKTPRSVGLFFDPRLGPGMFDRMMSVAEIKIPQVNRKWQCGLQHAH